MKDVFERFFSHVEAEPNGCLLWIGYRGAGYGRFGFEGRSRLAYHFLWERLFGPVPEGMTLDHLCRKRACVNPLHLEPVLHKINCERGDTGLHWRIKTHCPAGHPYSGENLYISPNGARHCWTCKKQRRLDNMEKELAQQRRRYHQNREKKL
jgi:hypothetical protein